MRILFDQGTPAPLRKRLVGHTVDTAFERGWSTLPNGELLGRAESNGSQVLITTDQSLRYQQGLTGRQLSIVVLLSTMRPNIRERVDRVRAVVSGIAPGEYVDVRI